MPGSGTKYIVAVSIPFTVGVVAAALLPLEGESYLWPALCSSAGLFPEFFLICRKGNGRTVVPAVFFLLGFLSYCSSSICGGPFATDIPASGKLLGRLTTFIDSAGFSSESTAALLKALLTGQKRAMGQETVAVFRESGASHILALSGLHLGIIYGIMSKALSVLGRSHAATVTRSVILIAASGFYVLMTGASASLVRAFLFICVNEVAGNAPGRRKSPLTAFCIAITIQLSVNPQAIESVSFQLSYLAMLGILTIYPLLEEWYPSGKGILRRIWNSIAMSVSCQIFTAPVVWYHFHTFPKYFIITNLVALPLTEALIISSVTSLCAEALGICPEILKGLCDTLAQALIYCLEAIASI